MNTSFTTRLQAIVLGTLAFQWALVAHAELHIEQVQRDFQARYHLVDPTQRFVQWPKCRAVETPAPQFPKDGYYGNISEDPDKGVALVQDLIEKFYTNNPIYTNFINAPNGLASLEGATTINNYTSGDFSNPGSVTATNYMEKLATIAAQVASLALIKVSASQIIETGDTKETYGSSGFFQDTNVANCATIQGCVSSGHQSTAWGHFDSYQYNVQNSTCGSPYHDDANSFANIARVWENNGMDDSDVTEGIVPNCYSRNTRGKIQADLTRYGKGAGYVFLQLSTVPCYDTFDPCTNFFAQTRPINSSIAENQYGIWANGELALGGLSTTAFVTESESAPTAMGSCVTNSPTSYGWQVNDALAIVAPDFATIPDPQDCCPCTTKCPAGTLTTAVQSLHINIGLGSDNFGGSAGALSLSADLPILALSTPAALRYSTATNVETIVDSYTPVRHLQFKSSQTLFNVITNNTFKYIISVYTAADAGSKDGNGFYQPTGTAFTTIVTENPDASTNTFNRLRITATNDSNVTVTDYIYTSASGQWEMDTGNGLRKETRTSTWDGSHTNRTETVTVKNSGDQIIYKELNTYWLLPWGEERVRQVIDPDTVALTNSWTFYSATNDGGNYRQLKQEADSNGHWTKYQYDPFGRETNRVTQFLNSATNSADNQNRVITTSYSTNEPQITVIESLLGIEISRRYTIVRTGEVQTIQCQTTNAATNAADNLITITKKYTNGSFAGQLRRVQNPDGTVQIYLYATNATSKTTTTLSGVPDQSNETNIVAGTKTITVVGLGGQTVSNIVKYVSGATEILTDQDVYTYLDSRNRSYYVTHLDGTSNQYSYACCGLDTEIDRDGTTTQYSYDSLKRQTASLRNSITTSNVLDPNGAVLATIRTGSDSSQILQRQRLYDVAGRISRETNALNGITIHTNYFDGSGQLVHQTTYPDTGTRIETFAKDGSLLSVSGSAAFPMSYLYGADSDGVYTTEIRLDINGGTNEWAKTYTDMIGRPYKTVYAAASGAPSAISYFDSKGQLTNQIDPDSISTLYVFNAKGEQTHSIIDSNRNYVIEFSGGSDRITFTTNDVLSDNGTNVRRIRSYVWKTSSDASNLVSTAETSVDGLQSWSTIWNNGIGVTSHAQTAFDPAHGYRITTNTAPDGSYSVTTNQNGRPISVTSRDSTGAQVAQTVYGYDAHGRQNKASDAGTGTTTNYFNNADQVSGMAAPLSQVTSNFFDNMGRAIASKLPDNTYVTNKFAVTSLLTNTFGSRTYPVAYTYDPQGRVKTMKTWQNYSASSGAATTTWYYDQYRGFLSSKTYDGGAAGPSYTYTRGGRLATRLWARGTNTTYTYNFAGDLSGISYNDSATPSISYTYDRRGRQAQISVGSISASSLNYDDVGNLLSESYSGGILNGLTVTNGYDSLLRRTTNGLWNGTSWLAQSRYTYDNASRLLTVGDGTNSAGYSYVANSPLVSQIAFTNSGTQRMVTTKQYDLLNRLTNISSSSSSSSSTFSYSYSSANQRTGVTNADGSYWVYSYDSLGQVTSGKKYWSGGTPVAGQQFEYSFDDIGNRKTAASGGDQWGANLRYQNYSENSLNQYTSRTVPGYFNDLGAANSNSTVTVWTSDGLVAQAYRKGEYFRGELLVNNSTGAIWLTITNLAVLNNGTNADIITNSVGNSFIPKTAEAFYYDSDGNLLSDGRWTNKWDGENHLISLTGSTNTPADSKRRLSFAYDHYGRRITKLVETWSGSVWTTTLSNKFLYDGWNLMAELNATNNAVIRSYVWGSDLSGSSQGAGGVGGLLAVNDVTNGMHFAAFDGNGNVSALVKASDGTASADYEYGPFGDLIRVTGSLGLVNPFRFSTKFQDDETGLLCYGYRYDGPSTGRWFSRDPIGEAGGINLYKFLGNNALTLIDFLGWLDYQWQNTGNPTATGPGSNIRLPLTGNQISAYGYGLDWFTGKAPQLLTLYAGDKMTEQLKDTPEVRQAREKLKQTLESVKCGEAIGKVLVSRSLKYSGYWANAYYVVDFADDLVRNPTRAFLGTFDGAAVVVTVCCANGLAHVHFHVWNKTGLESGFRLPWYGYIPRSDGSPRPNLPDLFSTSLPDNWKFSDVIPKSLLNDKSQSGFGSATRQDFLWDEDIKFTPKN